MYRLPFYNANSGCSSLILMVRFLHAIALHRTFPSHENIFNIPLFPVIPFPPYRKLCATQGTAIVGQLEALRCHQLFR